MTIGERIRTARERLSLSQGAAGDLAGMGGNAFGLYENNKRQLSSVVALESIAKALRVRVCWLVFGEGPMETGPLPANVYNADAMRRALKVYFDRLAQELADDLTADQRADVILATYEFILRSGSNQGESPKDRVEKEVIDMIKST
jgi:transcriptional regulator with XRE-family HTH domain